MIVADACSSGKESLCKCSLAIGKHSRGSKVTTEAGALRIKGRGRQDEFD